jgi:hypothetical protein
VYKYNIISKTKNNLEIQALRYVRTYTCTYYHYGTRVRTNITLSQKQLEIQALRCTMVLEYQWYHGTIPLVWYHGTMVWYHTIYIWYMYVYTCVPGTNNGKWYKCTFGPYQYHWYSSSQATTMAYRTIGMVWYTCTWYTCTNITLSQKQLERTYVLEYVLASTYQNGTMAPLVAMGHS